jgi:hypothetical protein
MNEDTPLIPASKVNAFSKSSTRKGRWQMFLLLMVCAAPVIASYVTFYLIKPTGGQTNYGELVFPVEPVPEEFLLPKVKGKWTLLMARPAQNCETDEEICLKQLFLMRQVRAAMGKEKSRLQIVWLVSDQAVISEKILNAYDPEIAGVNIIRMPQAGTEREQLDTWLNSHKNPNALQLLDPSGARMMQYPVSKDGPVFNKMRKDIEKLLKWNSTGKTGP